jgi:aryl-alcohol dehydrogenase-like predicted oxidoreductase
MDELSRTVPVETLQPPYHLFAREIEADVLGWCLDNDVSAASLRQNVTVVRQLTEIADGIGCTLSQLAIAWTLVHPAVDVAIVGSRSPAHIEESVGALDVQLADADLQQIETVMQGAVTADGPSPELNSN